MPQIGHDSEHQTISVALSDRGGWVLLVERNGQVVSAEHFTDWHRVERRRGLLEAKADVEKHLAPVARTLALVLLLALPAAAQGQTTSLMSEPGFVGKAVDLVTRCKDDESRPPKDGFYPRPCRS